MAAFFVSILLATQCLPSVTALPKIPSLRSLGLPFQFTPESPSLLSKRQGPEPTTLQRECASYGTANATTAAVAEAMAKYLEGVADRGSTCGIDRATQNANSYQNMVMGNGYQTNLFFTGRVPQVTHAEYDCRDLASQLRDMITACHQAFNGGDPVIVWQWLANCASKNAQFSGATPNPPVEGGTGMEFRMQDYPSPEHSGKRSMNTVVIDGIELHGI